MRSSRRREDLSLIISDVIQEDNVVREDLLDLVMSGAWRSSSERRVVKYERRVMKYDDVFIYLSTPDRQSMMTSSISLRTDHVY